MFEPVEVEIEQRDLAAFAPRRHQGTLQPVLEQRPVGQAGQGVVEGQVLRLVLAALQLGGRATEPAEQEEQHADPERQGERDRRGGLPGQRHSRTLRLPADITQRGAGGVGERHQRQSGSGLASRHVAGARQLVLAGDMPDQGVVHILHAHVQVFGARLLGQPLRARDQRRHADDRRAAAQHDQVLDNQIVGIVGGVGIGAAGEPRPHLGDQRQDEAVLVAERCGRQRLAVAHDMDGPVLGVQHENAVVTVIGAQPEAEIVRHPGLVAGAGEQDGVVPHRHRLLLAPERRELVLDAILDEEALPGERDAVRLHHGIDPEGAHRQQPEQRQCQHGQGELRGERPLLAVPGHGTAVVR